MSKKEQNIQQGVLFDAEEMGRITPGDIWEECNEPVTCLGHEFPNDDARREYFREELRKRLPELRQIEGFPIGKDEDIIRLSDPPYYTACPNPWLNDFIAEWEEEKKQLEAEGKRKADFEVKEPYASDVSEGKNNPVYNAHSYHTKIPHPAIMRYIMHFTQPGDIVFDGFSGTGMTGVACRCCQQPENDLRNKIETERNIHGYQNAKWGYRHAICGDLSPIASFISYNYNINIHPSKYVAMLEKAIDDAEKEIGWMYETHHTDGSVARINYVVWSDVFICKTCGHEIVFWDSAVDKETGEKHDDFTCPNCGANCNKKILAKEQVTTFDKESNSPMSVYKVVPVLIQYIDKNGKRHSKEPDERDIALIERINSMDTEYWYPTELILGKGEHWGHTWRSGNHVGITHVHHFFTRRNLYALATLLKHLMEVGDNHALSVFTSVVQSLCSKITRYNGGKRGNGSQPLTLYIGSLMAESNVFKVARGKISDFEKSFESMSAESNNNAVYCSSATSLNVASNSVDYIFTDPPFGENIVYSELNYITESWLKVKTDNEKEAIEEISQDKGLKEYDALMSLSFAEYYRILKPGGWMTVVFSNTSANVWNAIQQAINKAGFVIATVAALDKKQGSFNAVSSTTAVKQDLSITAYKPSEYLSDMIDTNVSFNPWAFIDEHISHLSPHIERDHKTTTVIERSPKILYDRLISFCVVHGKPVPMDAQAFQQGLRERYVERDGMFFTAPQAAEYEEKRSRTEGFAPMGIIVSDEANGIQWLKNLLRDGGKTYQEIQPEWMQAINGVRKNDILPELKQILEETFIEETNGKWRLPNIQDDKDVNALRTKALLKEFKLYVELAQKPKAKIKEARVEALRAGFKQCYVDKDFETIVTVGNKIPQNLLTEDEVLLQFYDIAQSKL